MDVVVSIIGRVLAEKDRLSVKVSRVFKNRVTFKAVDPKFVVAFESWANDIITEIMYSIEGSTVFGDGWATIPRRFPSSYVIRNYLLIFNPP